MENELISETIIICFYLFNRIHLHINDYMTNLNISGLNKENKYIKSLIFHTHPIITASFSI